MKKTLLTTVAAVALIAGSSFLHAQEKVQGQAPRAPNPAPAAQQSAPAEKTAPAMTQGAASDSKMDAKPSAQAQDSAKDRAKIDADKSAQTPSGKANTNARTTSDTKAAGDNKVSTDTKASSDTKAASDTKATTDTKSNARSTTGQGAAATSANITTEQRTKISTVIKQQNVQRVTNVNFSISVGTKVPRTVKFYPIPSTVISIYPDWRGYDYILVGDEMVIINPRTLEIVAVISV